MSWSTRELAELADTTERAVRHYHHVGLLPEPHRRANGYKQYGVAHLERLLRITLLTDLGFSLSQIAAMGAEEDPPAQALGDLDAELAAAIEKLQNARARLAVIVDPTGDADLPVDLAVTRAAARAGLTDADRSFMLVLTRVLGPKVLEAYAESLESYRADPATVEFDELRDDVDESTRQDLGERLARHTRLLWERYPTLREWEVPRGSRVAVDAVNTALRELYNSAQIDVLRRAQHELATGAADRSGRPPDRTRET